MPRDEGRLRAHAGDEVPDHDQPQVAALAQRREIGGQSWKTHPSRLMLGWPRSGRVRGAQTLTGVALFSRWRSGVMRTTFQASPRRRSKVMISPDTSTSHQRRPW